MPKSFKGSNPENSLHKVAQIVNSGLCKYTTDNLTLRTDIKTP